jgi:uncharacterized protein YprB with RNaseH-like and TPR domain
MLQNTFLHIPGVGIQTEHSLWSSGILSWEDCLTRRSVPLTRRKQDLILTYVQESLEQLRLGNPHYFGDRLPTNQLWRLFNEFRGSTAYLDIETTGLDIWGSHITTIALYDGSRVYHYIYGENLDAFREDIQKYQMIVSYNGKCFDVPVIQGALNMRMNHVHIDLRYLLASLGYKGGLKRCESLLGLDRGDLEGVDGYFAVLLWNDFVRNRNEKALETLLAYNVQDAVNLETLMVIGYNLKLRGTRFTETHQMPNPTSPAIPFSAHRDTIQRIRRQYSMSLYPAYTASS